MTNYWVICYAVKVKDPLPCHKLNPSDSDQKSKTFICKRCLCEWAKSKLMQDMFTDDVGIPCPNDKCSHRLSPDHLMKFCGPKLFEEINQVLTDIHISKTEDMRRCPGKNCGYAGVISLNTCRDKLEWAKCQHQWREKVQISYFSQLTSAISRELSNLDLYSYLNQMLTANTCPKWEEVIWKDGGWTHMSCQKCKYEFCWRWMGHYSGYDHKEPMPCGLRPFMRFWILLSMVIGAYTKLSMECFVFSAVNYFFWYIIKFILLRIILPNFLVFCLIMFPYVMAIALSNSLNQYISNCEKWKKRILGSFGFFGVTPFVYYITYKAYFDDRFNFLHTTIIYEVVGVLALALGVAVVFLVGLIFYYSVRLLLRFIGIFLNWTWNLTRRCLRFISRLSIGIFHRFDFLRKMIPVLHRGHKRYKTVQRINKQVQKAPNYVRKQPNRRKFKRS